MKGRPAPSTTTGPRTPGWHPDPDGGDHLRHWNGRKWGTEVRPRPSWAGGGGGDAGGGGRGGGGGPDGGDGEGPGPRSPGRSPRRWLVGGVVLMSLAALVLVVVSLSRGPRIPPRSVTDVSYTRRAQSVCESVLPELRAQRPERGERTKEKAEVVADNVERTADGLEKLVVRLRALPVAATDDARVDRWLDDWESYIAVGRRYSDELRRDEEGAPARAARDGDELSRRIYLFSKANGMPGCVP